MKTYTRFDNYLDILALVFNEAGLMEVGTITIVVNSDRSLSNVFGDDVCAITPEFPIKGWGEAWDDSQENLVEIAGGVTKKEWFEAAVASVPV